MKRNPFPVEKMCKVFGVSSSGYYRYVNAKPSARSIENQRLGKVIQVVFDNSDQTYGSPRVTDELRAMDYSVSRPKVARMMSNMGLRASKPKKFKVTTDSKHGYPVAPNLLERRFTTQRPNQVWVSDITYIRTKAGWLYLTVIIDLFDRKVIGWSMSHNLTAKATIISAWYMAVKNRPIHDNLVFHSDRGVQYACTEFTAILASFSGKVQQSMSRKGDCWDNAVAESFFKTIKTECIYRHFYNSKLDAELSVFRYIEAWYNRKRRHSALGNRTMEEFELFINQLKTAA